MIQTYILQFQSAPPCGGDLLQCIRLVFMRKVGLMRGPIPNSHNGSGFSLLVSTMLVINQRLMPRADPPGFGRVLGIRATVQFGGVMTTAAGNSRGR